MLKIILSVLLSFTAFSSQANPVSEKLALASAYASAASFYYEMEVNGRKWDEITEHMDVEMVRTKARKIVEAAFKRKSWAMKVKCTLIYFGDRGKFQSRLDANFKSHFEGKYTIAINPENHYLAKITKDGDENTYFIYKNVGPLHWKIVDVEFNADALYPC